MSALRPTAALLVILSAGASVGGAEEAPLRCPAVSSATLDAARQAAALASHPIHDAHVLGLPASRFSDIPVDTIEKLKSQVRRYHSEICDVLRQAGWPGAGEDFFAAIEALDESAARQLPAGERLQWMALRQTGEPTLQYNFRWAGAEPFAAWEVAVRSGDYATVFVIPWSCLNVSLKHISVLPRECALDASFDEATGLIGVESRTATRVSARRIDPETGKADDVRLPIERVGRGRWQLLPPDRGATYRFTGVADPLGNRPGGFCRAFLEVREPACRLGVRFDRETQSVLVTTSDPSQIETPRLEGSATLRGAGDLVAGAPGDWRFEPALDGRYRFSAQTTATSLRPGEVCFAAIDVHLDPRCRRPAMAHPGIRRRFADWDLQCTSDGHFVRTFVRPPLHGPEPEPQAPRPLPPAGPDPPAELQCVKPPIALDGAAVEAAIQPGELEVEVQQGEPLADWLHEVVPAFGLAYQPDDGWGLDLVGRRSSLGGTHLDFQQTLRGRKVVQGGRFKVNLDHEGCVVSIFGAPALGAPPPRPATPEPPSSDRPARSERPVVAESEALAPPPPPPPAPPPPPVYISSGEAIVIAVNRLRVLAVDSPYARGDLEWAELPTVEEVWYAENGELYQAYKVSLVCDRPMVAHDFTIGISGEILHEKSHISYSAAAREAQVDDDDEPVVETRGGALPAAFARKYGSGWEVLRDTAGRLSGLLRTTEPSGLAPDPRELLRDAAEAFEVGAEDVEEIPVADGQPLEFRGTFRFGEARLCGLLQVSRDFRGHVQSVVVQPLAEIECEPAVMSFEAAAAAAPLDPASVATEIEPGLAQSTLIGGRKVTFDDPVGEIFAPSPVNTLNDSALRDDDTVPETAYAQAELGKVEVDQPLRARRSGLVESPVTALAGRPTESFRVGRSEIDHCSLRLNPDLVALPGPSFTFQAVESGGFLRLDDDSVLVTGEGEPSSFCLEPIDQRHPPPARADRDLSGIYRLQAREANKWITLDEDRPILRAKGIAFIRGMPPVFQVERQQGNLYRVRPLGSCGRDPSGLANEFVRICDREPPFRLSPTDSFGYRRTDKQFESVMVLHHIRDIQLYIQSLGFSNVGNRQIDVDPHVVWDPEAPEDSLANDESMYNGTPGAGRILFGVGGVDDAEDAELIAHEYGHAIQDHQTPRVWTSTDMAAAMGEGFGDYLAVSFFDSATRSSGHDRSCFAEWNVAGDENPCQRRVDESQERNPDLTPHTNGKVWSRTLWEMLNRLGEKSGRDEESRLAAGRTLTDMLVFQSHFNAPSGLDFEIGADAILTADQQLDVVCRSLAEGGAPPPALSAVLAPESRLEQHCANLWEGTHEDVLCPIFIERGIFPAACPERAKLCDLAAQRGSFPSGCSAFRSSSTTDSGDPTITDPTDDRRDPEQPGSDEPPTRTKNSVPTYFGFRLWATFPIGSFDAEIDPGPALSLDWERPVDDRWSLRLSIAGSRFRRAPDDFYYLSAALAARLYAASGPGRRYLDLGAGFYAPKEGSSDLGLLIGGGLELPIDERMRVEVGFQHHHVDPGGLDRRFFEVTSGIKFQF